MKLISMAARLFACLLFIFQLSACGPIGMPGDPRYEAPGVIGPARIPLTNAPVAINISKGTLTYDDISVILYGGPNRDEFIASGSFKLSINSSQTVSGINFSQTSGTLAFVMNYAQYSAIKSPSGAPLTMIRVSLNSGPRSDITGFGDRFLGLRKAYYYAFAGTAAQPAASVFDYAAETDRLMNISKRWRIARDGTTYIDFTEQCAAYVDSADAAGVCTTDYSNSSAYAASTTRNLEPGIYDVTIDAFDKVPNQSVGTFGAKLIVGPHPVASLRLSNPTTYTIGSTLLYDAAASLAGTGATVAYSLDKPAASHAVLANEDAKNPSFVADVAGIYTLTLTITFNGEVSRSSVSRRVFPILTGASS